MAQDLRVQGSGRSICPGCPALPQAPSLPQAVGREGANLLPCFETPLSKSMPPASFPSKLHCCPFQLRELSKAGHGG